MHPSIYKLYLMSLISHKFLLLSIAELMNSSHPEAWLFGKVAAVIGFPLFLL